MKILNFENFGKFPRKLQENSTLVIRICFPGKFQRFSLQLFKVKHAAYERFLCLTQIVKSEATFTIFNLVVELN